MMAYKLAEMKLNQSSRAPDQITLQLKLHKKENKSYIHATAYIAISTAIVFSMVNCACNYFHIFEEIVSVSGKFSGCPERMRLS